MNNKKIEIIINSVTLLLLFCTIIKIVIMIGNISCISIMYNAFNEVRDYASFRLAHLILEGKNPYTFNNLTEWNTPFLCLYPPLYAILVAIICKVTGFTVIAGFYFVNIVLYLLTAYNIWLIIKKYIVENKLAGLFCVLINTATFFSLFGLPIFNFHTDTIAIYIASLIYLYVYKDEQRTLPLAILSVLLIFTKQILIVIAVPLFAFYFVIDKKLALKYVIECIICGIYSLVIIQSLFPLYWTETLYAQFVVSKGYGSFDDAIRNIRSFYFRYNAYFSLILAGIFGAIIIRIHTKQRFTFGTIILELIREEKYIVFLVLNVIFGTLFLLYFAKCGDDGYKYCQDILAPACYLLSIFFWNKYFARYLNQVGHGDTISKRFLILAVVCIASVITYNNHFSNECYTRDDIDSFVNLNNELASHRGEKMYLGIKATQFLMNENIWESSDIFFNDGQIEYFDEEYPDLFINRFFYEGSIYKATKEYTNRVNSMANNKEFGVIVTCLDNIIDKSILEKNYYIYKTYKTKTDTNGLAFELSLWLPIRS